MQQKFFYVVVLFFWLSLPNAAAVCSYSGGNWVIESEESCLIKNEQITLNGNLTINGNLSFYNVTIVVQPQGGIFINTGGNFIVNTSNITSENTSYVFPWVVETNSTFILVDSIITNAGTEKGLEIWADNSVIKNNKIYLFPTAQGQFAIVLRGNNITIKNNYFNISGNSGGNDGAISVYYSDWNTIEDNTIYTYESINIRAGIKLKYANNNKILNNKINQTTSSKNAWAVWMEYSSGNIFRNTSPYTRGRGSLSYWLRAGINDNDIDDSNLADGKPYIFINSSTVFENRSGLGAIGIYADNVVLKNLEISPFYEERIMPYWVKNITIFNITATSGRVVLALEGTSNFTADKIKIHQIHLSRQSKDSSISNVVLLIPKTETYDASISTYSGPMRNINITNITIYNNYSSSIINLANAELRIQNMYVDRMGASNTVIQLSNANLTLINATYDDAVLISTSSNLYRYWYLDVYARDASGQPVAGVNVTAYDAFGNLAFSALTDASGYIPRQTLLAYNQTSSGKIYHYPYTITAQMQGYNFGSRRVNLTGNTLVEFAPANETWTLSFIARDANSPYSGGNFSIWLDDQKIYEYNIGAEGHWGYVEFDLSSYNPEGKVLKLRINGIKASGSSDRFGVVLTNLTLTKNGKHVLFTPWTFYTNCTTNLCSGHAYTDDWLEFTVEGPPQYVSEWRSSPISSNASELVVKPSHINLSKRVYEISDGDSVEFNITVFNLGYRDEANATLLLRIGNETLSESSPIPAGSNRTFAFAYTFNFSRFSGNLIPVNITAIPSNPSLEGKKSNNGVAFYVVKHRPYLLFRYWNETMLHHYNSTEPYKSWMDSFIQTIENYPSRYINYDFCDSGSSEQTKAVKLAKMALYYWITGNKSYANKTMQGLACIGSWSDGFLNRSMEGNVTPGSGDAYNQNYGISTTSAQNNGHAVVFYSIAYDLLHNYISSYDQNHSSAYLRTIRDRLMRMTSDMYLLMKEHHDYDVTSDRSFDFGDYLIHRFPVVAGAGVGALALPDCIECAFVDDRGTHAMVQEPLEDLVVESKSGALLPALEQELSSGIRQDAAYILYYEEPGTLSLFFGLYNSAFNTHLEEKYKLVWQYLINNMILPTLPSGWWDNRGGSTYKQTLMHPCILERYLSGFARGLANRYCRDVVVNSDDTYTYQTSYPASFLMGSYAWLAMLNYNHSFTYSFDEPSVLDVEHEIFVFRSNLSFEDRNALYMFVKLRNDSQISGYGMSVPDALAYNLYAKGAYLIPHHAAIRLGFDWYRQDEEIVGTTTFYFNESGYGFVTQAPPAPKSSRDFNVSDPPYIVSAFTSDDIDFLHGHREIKRFYDGSTARDLSNPVNWDRYILFPNNEYFVVIDRMSSNASRVYKLIIPLGTTERVNASAAYVNQTRANGTFYINGVLREWWDEAAKTNINISVENVSRLVWATWSEGDGGSPSTPNKLDTYASYPVNLTLWFMPSLNIEIGAHRFHWGYFTKKWAHWITPHVVAGQDSPAPNQKFITLLYPSKSGETLPVVGGKEIGDGDDYAAVLRNADGTDLISISDGENVTYENVSTDAEVAFSRVNKFGEIEYILLENFTFFKYKDEYVLRSSNRTGFLYFSKNHVNMSITIISAGNVTLTLAVAPGYEYSITREGAIYNGWGYVDSKHLWIAVPSGKWSFEIRGAPAGELTITLLSPAQRNYSTANISISGYVNYPAQVNYSLNAGENVTLCEGCTAFAGSVLAKPGDNTLVVYANNGTAIAEAQVSFSVVGMSDHDLLVYIDRWARREVGDAELLQAIETWARGYVKTP